MWLINRWQTHRIVRRRLAQIAEGNMDTRQAEKIADAIEAYVEARIRRHSDAMHNGRDSDGYDALVVARIALYDALTGEAA